MEEERLPKENSLLGPLKVECILEKDALFIDYLVEHLYLNKLMRLRLLTEKRLYERKCFSTILADLRTFAQLSHPGIVELISVGRHGKYFFYITQHREGPRLSDWLVDKRASRLEWFCDLAWQLLEVLYYLHSSNISWERLTLSDIYWCQEKIVLREINPFNNLLPLVTAQGRADLKSQLSTLHGIYVKKDDFNLKENIKNIGKLLFGLVSAGRLEDAFRKYDAALEAHKKKKDRSEKLRLIPEVDSRIEQIIINTFKPREQGGYSSIKEIINEVKALTKAGVEAQKQLLAVTPSVTSAEESKERAAQLVPGLTPDLSESIRETTLPPEVQASILSARRQKRALRRSLFIRVGAVATVLVLLLVGLYLAGFILQYNHAPVAKIANEAVTTQVNASLLLNGSQSYDKDNDKLTYQWRVVEPAEKQDKAVFTINDSAEAAMPQVYFLERGDYKIELRVFDGSRRSDPAYIGITVY